MNSIKISNATANNLKNVSVDIPLGKLVAVVGKSGSGKSSLVYDVLYQSSQGHDVEAKIGAVPRTFAIAQRVKAIGKKSLGETNMEALRNTIGEMQKGDLLIADEPCAGMAKEDRMEVLEMLKDQARKGVSVIVVEHSRDVIAGADYVIEFGPESGAKGGEVVFQGTIDAYRKAKTPTSEYVFSDKASKVGYRRKPSGKAMLMSKKTLSIKGIDKNGLRNFTFKFPLSSLVCVSGRMGTGKSTLLSVVYGALFKGKDAWKMRHGFKSIEGKTHVRRSYLVDQSLLSRISTSTPATYLGIWDSIRDIYAGLPESRKARLNKSHFSFNNKSVARIKERIGKIKLNGKSIYDVLEMTVDEAAEFFAGSPLAVRKLGFLREVGLGYLALGQKSGTLSGGEAQRVRLAKILSKKLGDRCIYILDIPSRGLHLSDLPVLVKVLQKIIDKNNTVLIAENREELISNCDYVLDLKK